MKRRMAQEERKSIELYPLPSPWQWMTVNDVGAPIKNAIVDGPFGSNLKVSDYVENGTVPVLTTKNMEGNYDNVRYITEEKRAKLDRSTVRGGDILMAKIGSCGKTGIYPTNMPPAMIPANLLKVTVNDRFDGKYVYHYFNSTFFQNALKTITKATAQPAFGITNFKKLPLPYVPIDQQKLIVAEIEKQFSRLDEAVAGLKRVKANIKRYKAAVLKAAVEGRLVETEAELARREGRSYETGEKLLRRILEERRSQWKGKGKYKEPSEPDTTDLPALPEGWVWVTWEQVGCSKNGRAFPSRDYCDKGIRLLRPGNLHESGALVWTSENTRHMPNRYKDENKDLVVRGRELIMNLTAQSLKDEFLGRICLTSDGEYCLLNQRLARLAPIELLPEFVLVVFKSKLFRNFVDGLNTGSLIQHMFTSQLATFAFPLPSLKEQQRIVAEVDRSCSLAFEVEEQVDANLKRANRMRQSILNSAFTGTLNV